MNLLLDTHVLLWFLNDDPQLALNAKSLIEEPDPVVEVNYCCWPSPPDATAFRYRHFLHREGSS